MANNSENKNKQNLQQSRKNQAHSNNKQQQTNKNTQKKLQQQGIVRSDELNRTCSNFKNAQSFLNIKYKDFQNMLGYEMLIVREYMKMKYSLNIRYEITKTTFKIILQEANNTEKEILRVQYDSGNMLLSPYILEINPILYSILLELSNIHESDGLIVFTTTDGARTISKTEDITAMSSKATVGQIHIAANGIEYKIPAYVAITKADKRPLTSLLYALTIDGIFQKLVGSSKVSIFGEY